MLYTYERACFNIRVQEEGEPVDSFITALYSLSEHCQFGALQDEMLRDRIVVGIRNAPLSEKLQLDPTLTLEKAVTTARQTEAVKEQQPLLRSSPVGAIHKSRRGRLGSTPQNSSASQYGSNTCTRCGRAPAHERPQCPAREATCRNCGKKGHFRVVCRTPVTVRTVENQDYPDYQDDQDGDQPLEDAFMGAVGERNPWVVTLKLNGTLIKFCIDTGAEVTVISEQIHDHAGRPFLSSPDRTLKGPDAHCLPVKGYFIATLQWGTKETRQRVYVVERLNKPLLGRPAIEKLGLLMHIGAIDQDTSPRVIQQFPLLFKGLGKLQGEYKIKLQKGATPFALTCPLESRNSSS